MSRKKLDSDAIKYMVEKVEGSFSFSILDDKENLYLVKGDSPLHILHFPKSEIYVYASTEAILFKALVDTPLFGELKKGEYMEVAACEGDILKFSHDGTLEKSRFLFRYSYGKGWWEYGLSATYTQIPYSDNEYVEELKSAAAFLGISPEDIDELLADGITLEELEEYIYGE